MAALYTDPRTIPLGPKRTDDDCARAILALLNQRLGSGGSSGSGFPLTSTVSAGGFGITNLGSLGFAAGFSTTQGFVREIWISATRADNPTSASGSPLDPLDGSTQVKFDAIIQGMSELTHAHLLPGTFLTRGNATCNIQSGCWLHGAGMGETIIQLSSLAGNPTPIMMINPQAQNNPYTKVSDITFDGNATALAAGSGNSINAVELTGDYCVIERCEAINMYSHFASGKENFTFKIANWQQVTTSTGYTQPNVGVGVTIPVANTTIFAVTDTVRAQTAAGVPQGWYTITAINAGVSITGTNQGFASSVAPTTVIGAVNVFNEHGVRNVKIVDCVERLHLGNYGSSFVMFSDYNKAQSGDIIGCKCYDRAPTVTPVNGFGGFTGNQERGRIINGYAENCSHFFYCEGPVANVQIQGCVARNLTCTAFRLNGSGGNLFSNIEINDCDFEINNSPDPSGGNIKWAINTTAPTQGNINNLRINNTRIALKSSGATTTYALLLGMSSQVSLSCVQIDSGLLNNFDATNVNKFSLFENVTCPDGTFITLAGNNGLPGTIICKPSNDAVTSGNIFLSFYAQAKLIYPNNAARSATNRVSILVQPSKYDFGSQTWTYDTNFIDVIGLGQREDVLFTSSADCCLLSVASADFRWKSFTLQTSSASGSVYGLNRSSNSSTAEVMEDIVLNGAGTLNSIRNTGATNSWFGYYKNIWFKNGGFFSDGQSQFGGTAEYIIIGTAALRGADGTNNIWISAGARLSYFFCNGRMNMFSQNGIVEYGTVITTAANTDAMFEQSVAIGAGGITRFCTLIANGTGTAYKNNGGSRNTAIYNCSSNADIDSSIVNVISPAQQFNVKDATNIVA